MILVPMPMSVYTKMNPLESLKHTPSPGHIRCAIMVDMGDGTAAASFGYKVLMRYLAVFPQQ
jgi:hypothetical protein